MKKLIILFILLSVKFSSQSSNYDYVYARVRKIDSTSHNYIVHLKKHKKRIIVPVYKECNNPNGYLNKIKVGEKYNFILAKEINYTKTQISNLSQVIDGVEIWNSNMPNTIFYPNCKNMCGLFIK